MKGFVGILIFFTGALVTAGTVEASSLCSCEGEAEAIARDDVSIPQIYGDDIRDPSRDKFERLIKLDIKKTRCQGHSCCPDPKRPLHIWIGEKSKGLWGYRSPVTFKGERKQFEEITVGRRIRFKYFCVDSAPGQGMNSFEVLQFID